MMKTDHAIKNRNGASKTGAAEDSDLVTKRQGAAIIQSCPATIYRLGKSGRIGVVRLGARLVRYRRSDILKLIAEATTVPNV